MRILQIHRSLGAGGIEALICDLSNELVKSDDVTVCVIRKPDPTDIFYSKLSDKVHKDSIYKKEWNGNPLKTVFRVYRYIRKGGFDVVHMHCFFYFYALAVILLHKKTRFYYTIHSDAFKENRPWDQRLLFFKRFCFKRKWARPVTISEVSRQSFLKLYGFDSKLIINGIARPIVSGEIVMDGFKITPNTKVFIHAGRICPEKNQVMLCQVFSHLIKEGFDVALVIAGPMHVRSVMDGIEPFLSDRIRYVGEKPDVPSMMKSSFGMCLTSFYEGLPIVLLEALATGCVPICTPVGGITDVVKDNTNGFLSETVNVESYYQTMKRVLQTPSNQMEEIRAKCVESFKDYDITITAQRYRKYYEAMQDGDY